MLRNRNSPPALDGAVLVPPVAEQNPAHAKPGGAPPAPRARRRRNPLRFDPSRTGLIRKQFTAELLRRLERIRSAVWQLVAKQDVFGLVQPQPPTILYDPNQPRDEQGRWTSSERAMLETWASGHTKQMKLMKSAEFGKAVRKGDVVKKVWRGVYGMEVRDLKKGAVLRLGRHVPTSSSKRVATDFARFKEYSDTKEAHLVEIEATAFDISKGVGEKWQHQQEAVIPKGTVVRFLGKTPSGRKMTVYRFKEEPVKTKVTSFASLAELPELELINYDPNQPRDEQGRWTSGGIAYHGTSESKLKAILKEGLRSDVHHNYGWMYYTGKRAGAVFMLKGSVRGTPKNTDKLDTDPAAWDAVKYAQDAAELAGKNVNGVVLAIRVPKGTVLEKDLATTTAISGMKRSFYFKGNIPPEWIIAHRKVPRVHQNKTPSFKLVKNEEEDESEEIYYVVLLLTDDEPTENLTANAPGPKAFQFKTKDEKLKSFNRWFADLVNQGILEVDRTTRPWLAKYVESAYKKGAIRSYLEAHKKELGRTADFYAGTREQFLRSAFETPERMSKLKLLGTRAFEELKGISAEMSRQMSRVLADGMAHGKGPYEIARTMSNTITGIERKRAKVLARTEIIHAHAEGQLDGYEEMGVEEVSVDVEWSTAGDDLVCELCDEMEGEVFTIDEARGLIPKHPNCRCAWKPHLQKLKRGK